MKQAQLRSHPGNQAFRCSGPVTLSSTWRCRPHVRSLVDWSGPRTLTTGRLQEWTTNRVRIVARTRDTTMTRWIRSMHSKYDTNRHQYMDPGRLIKPEVERMFDRIHTTTSFTRVDLQRTTVDALCLSPQEGSTVHSPPLSRWCHQSAGTDCTRQCTVIDQIRLILSTAPNMSRPCG